MRRWLTGAIAASVLLGGAGLVAQRFAGEAAAHRAPPLRSMPCGGEQLAEDTFPPAPQGLASTASTAAGATSAPAAAAASSPASSAPSAGNPGGTMDAPGAPDGRPEQFRPDAAAFQALIDRLGATVRLSVFRTNFSHASPAQAANIALVAKKLTGVVTRAGAVFSYNRAVGPFTAAGGFGWGRMFVGNRIVPSIGGGVCQGASTLYNVVLLADLQVVERHRHGLTVPYLDPGRDATVTENGGLDFRFRNNTGGPVVLWAEAQARWLSIAAYGVTEPPKVRIETDILARTPFRTQIINDPKLPPGQENVVAAGQQGARSRTYIIVDGPGGPQRRLLSQDSYRPSPRIILRGPAPRS